MNAFLRTTNCRRTKFSTRILRLYKPLLCQAASCTLGRSLLCSSQATTSIQKKNTPTTESYAHRNAGRIPQVPYGFRELGIRDSIAKAIETTFPDVQRPTIAQADFIPAILNGKDVLLHDDTGTGKSFGSIVALLNKPRTRPSHGQRPSGPSVTSLVIVPHRDLGYQMMHWVESILKHSGPGQPHLDSLAQLVARSESVPMEEQMNKLRDTPPHILIGTPRALWDIYCADQKVLQLENVATVVLDEVDYLLDIPPPYVRKSRESAVWKNFKKHPSLTRQFLEAVLPERKPDAVPLADIDYNDDGDSDVGINKRKAVCPTAGRPLQLVLSSATVHSNLTDFLCDARWLCEDRVILSGKQLLKVNSHMLGGENAQKPRIVHHAFVVSSDGRLQNAEFAMLEDEKVAMEDKDEHKEDDALPKFREKLQKMQNVPPQSPTSPIVMEAIASVFATDVPQLALLVIPPGSSVQKVILELRDLGIDARPLDLRSRHIDQFGPAAGQGETEPILLVATPAAIRGVDLPQLTHVFCAGAPDTTSADVFKHVSGRVGRFGREGKVMTFVTEREVERRDGIVRTTKNPAGLLKAFYRNLRIKPVWFNLDAVDFDS